LDTQPTHESLYEWLQRRGFPGLPAEPRQETSPRGEEVLHHPDGCHHGEDTAHWAERPGPEGTPRLCGCLFKDSLDATAGQEFLNEQEFLNKLGALHHMESVFQRSVREDPYGLGDGFPQLRGLVTRHHRWYAEKAYRNRNVIKDARGRANMHPALKQVGEDLVGEWDAVIAANQPEETLLNEEIVRYTVRHLMSRIVLRKTLGLHLPLMNALQDIVWKWLSKPVTTTLIEEYFSERGDTLRKHACDPLIGSHFRMGLLDEIDEETRQLLARDTLMACHLGGPDTTVFETEEGLRPVIIWNGIRALRGSFGLGEYPQVACEWFSRQDEERKRNSLVRTSTPGGAVIPICENPGLDPHQWETALVLWDESFANSKDDPGPYRDQKTAIHAAATL